MSLTNPNTPVSQQDLQDFYHKLLPYMGGSSTGGGHTIEDSDGTDLTQRDTLQFGEGFIAEDDDTNEKTVISPDVMQSGDMSDVITPLPSVAPKKEGIKYSTTEQVIGEWVDGKPLYQKTFINLPISTNNAWNMTEHGIANIDTICGYEADINYDADILMKVGGYIDGGSFYSATQVNKTGVYLYNHGYTNKTWNITVRYTKTTDTPNT